MNTEELSRLSIEELRNLNKRVISVIKAKQILKGQDVASELSVGGTVKVNSTQKGISPNEEWEVIKVNRTKAVLKRKSNGIQFTVPLSMIKV